MQETQEMLLPSLGQEDPLEEEMATHSNILAWKIPWTEEPGRLPVQGITKESETNEHTHALHNIFQNQKNKSKMQAKFIIHC